MTDQRQFFKGPLRPTRRTIKVGGGRLFCREMGEAWMVTSGGMALLRDCLLVPGLGANLMSVRKACAQAGLQGTFNASKMYLHKNDQIVLSAHHDNGVYSIDFILSPKLKNENAFSGQSLPDSQVGLDKVDAEIDDVQMEDKILTTDGNINTEDENSQIKPQSPSGVITGDSEPVWKAKEMMHKNRLDRYDLMHRRLGHVGSAALAKMHNVTTLHKPIIIPQKLPKCETCIRANIKNRFSKRIAPHPAKRLAVISVDVAGPFPVSIRGNSYFAEVIDNWSRKVWILLLTRKSELPDKLNELSIILERQSGEEILAGRSDGAPEILKIFGVWRSKRGIVTQTTAPYSSNQNGTVERGIQSSEREARALLEDSGMPVEFWDYAVESGAYVRNRLQRGPWVEKEVQGSTLHQQLSPEGAWTGIHEQEIDHLRVWGCHTIPYVDINSMPSHSRKDKLMPRGRDAVFIGYVNETTKQWKVWAPDLRRVIVVKRAEFFEDKKGGNLNLNLNMKLSNGRLIDGNGTPNTMPERNPRGRPPKNPVLPRQVKRTYSGVEHLMPVQKPESLGTETNDTLTTALPEVSQAPDHKLDSESAENNIIPTQRVDQALPQTTQAEATPINETNNNFKITKSLLVPLDESSNNTKILKSTKISSASSSRKIKVEKDKTPDKRSKTATKRDRPSEKDAVQSEPITLQSVDPTVLTDTETKNLANIDVPKPEDSQPHTNYSNVTQILENSNSPPSENEISLPQSSTSPTTICSKSSTTLNEEKLIRSQNQYTSEPSQPSKPSKPSKLNEQKYTIPFTPVTTESSRIPIISQMVPKRKRDSLDDGGDDVPNSKILKAMLAMLEKIEADDEINESNAFLTEELVSTAFLSSKVDSDIPIPVTYDQAVNDPKYGSLWQNAIDEEIQSLLANYTWREEVAPNGINTVGTKWVFSVKYKADGTFERLKARLVARGFTQQYGVDYTETFAPTVQMATMRAFLSIVAAENLECWQFDIKNAFTESEIKETVYLKPPQGIKVTKGKSLRVLRSLYGLKQSARDWNLLLRSHIMKWGFVQSSADPCLFTNKRKSLIALVYVDDIAVAGKCISSLKWFSETLSSRFNTKNLGEIQKILGMRITRNRHESTIFIDQEHYLDKILRKFGFPKPTHKVQKIPIEGYDSLRPATEGDVRVDPSEYSMIVGSVMFAMVYTRPDIAFALGRLSQFMKDPAEHHMAALKKLLRYLRSTIGRRLRFGPGGESSLVVYSDADWASDRNDRKSITGSIGILCGGAIFWLSRKQKSVATSTAEAEYTAMAVTAKQGQWIAQVLRDMGYPQYVAKNAITVQTRGDNQGAIHLVKNPVLSERSKHIDISYHFIRDLAEKQRIAVEYIPTNEMIADGLTKPLPRIGFQKFVDKLGLVD
ncbi:hypothetical protein K3495_g12913 [Podosphaera aphanis]|nr:hypothetical protein K3495_g12913 [Podosphaera aphanis]